MKLEQITIGGEAADQSLLNSLKKTFPNARVTHIYASTEAGVGMSVSDGLAGFPLGYLNSTFRSVELTIKDGRLHLRSLKSASKYVGEIEEGICSQDGWIDSGDLVEIIEDRFFVIGRESGIINVGGDKIPPEKVRREILEHKWVKEAIIYGKKNPFTGNLIIADVQLEVEVDKTKAKQEIQQFLETKLQPFEVPRIFNFVDEIEINLAGKLKIKK